MVDRQSVGTRGVWPRAAALLVRQALEVALKTFWSARARGLEEAPMHAQLLCLAGTLNDADVGSRAHAVWSALSRACHYHAYDLAPTREELLAWCDDVAMVIERTESEWR